MYMHSCTCLKINTQVFSIFCLFFQISIYAFSVFFVFAVTISLFPAVVSNIQSTAPDPKDSIWTGQFKNARFINSEQIYMYMHVHVYLEANIDCGYKM